MYKHMIEEFYKLINKPTGTSLTSTEKYKYTKYIITNIFDPRKKWCEENGLKIELDIKDIKFLEDFSERKARAKYKEYQGKDDKRLSKRNMTGSCIEFAVLKLFKRTDLFDDSINTDSRVYSLPDLVEPAGVICDIKGSSLTNVPLVFKSSRWYSVHKGNHVGRKYRCANLIGCTDHKVVWLLGIASPTVLEKYVDENLKIMADAPTKTGFYGVDQLTNIPATWESFREQCQKHTVIEK